MTIPSLCFLPSLHFESERSQALLVLLNQLGAVLLSILDHTRITRGAGLGTSTADLEASRRRGGRSGAADAREDGGR
jgi:hypothetical protein